MPAMLIIFAVVFVVECLWWWEDADKWKCQVLRTVDIYSDNDLLVFFIENDDDDDDDDDYDVMCINSMSFQS